MNCKFQLNRKFQLSLLAVGVALLALARAALAQDPQPQDPIGAEAALGTAFTYQGQLTNGGSPVNGACDVQFSLWDAAGSGSPPSGGTQIGGPQTATNTNVINGLFTVSLDFGSSPFTGQARWLEIAVRCPAGSGGFTTLSPRQALTPAPYALGFRPGALISGTGAAPSYAGLVLHMDGGDGLRVNAASYDGIHVETAGYDGVYVGSAGGYGVNIISATTALRVDSATYGLSVSSADTGVRLYSANSDGVHIDSAANDGVDIDTAMIGVRVGAASQGLRVVSATTGVHVESATDGVVVDSADNEGLRVGSAATGVRVSSAATGVRVVSATDGVVVESATADGLRIESAGIDGVNATSTSALFYGGRFRNTASGGAGLYARGGSSDAPDIVLGGAASNDGRICSDPAGSSSDIWLVSNDDVQVRLDSNTGEAGTFTIVGDLGIGVFSVDESGNMTALGTKTAVVTTEDYGRRKLYAVESPQNWFEDFGSAELVGGIAAVTIEPVFAQTVNLSEYHVFLTPLGDCPLYVAEKAAASFTVRAMGGQTCNIAFDYRLVAKRLGYEQLRLESAATAEVEGTK